MKVQWQVTVSTRCDWSGRRQYTKANTALTSDSTASLVGYQGNITIGDLAGGLDRHPEVVRVDIGAFSLTSKALNGAEASIDCPLMGNDFRRDPKPCGHSTGLI